MERVQGGAANGPKRGRAPEDSGLRRVRVHDVGTEALYLVAEGPIGADVTRNAQRAAEARDARHLEVGCSELKVIGFVS